MATDNITQELLDQINGPPLGIKLELTQALQGDDYFGERWRETGLPDMAIRLLAQVDQAARGAGTINAMLSTDEDSCNDRNDNPHDVEYKDLGPLQRGGLRAAQATLLCVIEANLEHLREWRAKP